MSSHEPTKSRGYLYGLRQPLVRLELRLPKPMLDAASDSAALQWASGVIIERFELAAPVDASLDHPEKKTLEENLADLIGCTANALLQAIRIPSFETPKAICNSNNKGLLIFFGPLIEHHPTGFFEKCYAQAANLVFILLANRHDTTKIDKTFESLHQIFIEPLSQKVPGGKSTVPILKVAYRIGIPFRHLAGGIYQLGWGSAARLMDRSSVDLDSSIGTRVSTNKMHTALILRAAGLPVPRHFQAPTIQEAQLAAKQLGFPVVIKPNDRERGEGVTVNVSNPAEVESAFRAAQVFSPLTLVEQQIAGVCHRLFVAQDQLLFAVKRNPKSVVGDGERSIEQLINFKNQEELKKAKHKQLKPWPQDALALQSAQSLGYSFDSVPPKGVRVPLRPIESTEWGGDAESVTDVIHPENIQLAIDAARLLRLEVAGIDLITTDITKPWHATGAMINEVNFAPFFASSRPRTQAAMERFLERLLPNQGRIPVTAYIGGAKVKAKAELEYRNSVEKHVACFLCSHEETRSPIGVMHLPAGNFGLFERVQYLLMNRAVEQIIMVVQNDEFLTTGLPLDRLDDVYFDAQDPQVISKLLDLFRLHSKSFG
jgi:cyanophycin synthetase